MRVRCIVMQRNERALLVLWLRHHGLLFGLQSLCVIDNGSDDEATLAVLRQAERLGVQVVRGYPTPQDFAAKGEIVADLIRSFDRRGDYDLAIPMDCDEMLAAFVPQFSLHQADIIAACRALCAEDGNYITNRTLLNVPNRPGYVVPHLIQRGLFRANTLVSLDHGFHAPVSRIMNRQIISPLVHVHLHNRPSYEDIRRFARQKLRHLTGGDETRLTESRTEGEHLAYYFRTEAPQFEAAYRGRPDLYVPDLAHHIHALKLDIALLLGAGGIAPDIHAPEGFFVHRSDEAEHHHVFDRFDGQWYADHHRDVTTDNHFGLWPLVHFIQHGWDEGRSFHAPDQTPITVDAPHNA